ncbi:hypothetical protein [Burkholderia gladioli]|nr:hypothetical protein [Burkholderia gladioli]
MDSSTFDQIEGLQNHLVNVATGGDSRGQEYKEDRAFLLSKPELARFTPRFIKTCRSTGEFWQFIKNKFPTYQERRAFIWEEFRPLLDYLESGGGAPADHMVSAEIDKFDAEHIKDAWTKALGRRESD